MNARRTFLGGGLLILFLVVAAPAASGAHHGPSVKPGASKHAFTVDAFAPGSPSTPVLPNAAVPTARPDEIESNAEAGETRTVDVCSLNGTAICDDTCPDGSIKTVTYFLSDTGVPSGFTPLCSGARSLTAADVAAAFRQIPMQPSPIHIQPPHGETLVNFDSIFYTDPFALDVTKRPLGVPVAFHITVQKYIWHFGDGSSLTTTDAGAAYPDQTLVHRYPKKGPVSVTLETVYQADYSIDGGPQQHLADTVTRTSPAQQLTVLTATPHLVAD